MPGIEVELSAYILVSTSTRSIIFQNSHSLPPRLSLEDSNSSKPGITFVRHMALCMHSKVICAFRSVFAPTTVILTSFDQQLVLALLWPSRMFMVGVTARHLYSIASLESRTHSYSTKWKGSLKISVEMQERAG